MLHYHIKYEKENCQIVKIVHSMYKTGVETNATIFNISVDWTILNIKSTDTNFEGMR